MRPPGRRLDGLLLPLLRGSAGRLLGRRLAVLEYEGRRTGRPRQLVAQYVRAGDRVVITVGAPERKTWWRNFRAPHPVRLRLAGRQCVGTGHVEAGGDALRVVVDLAPTASGADALDRIVPGDPSSG